MKAYVYNYVDGLTDNWHDGGGLLIITEGDPQQALNLELAGHEPYKQAPTLPEPDAIYKVHKGQEEKVFIFPDSGCC